MVKPKTVAARGKRALHGVLARRGGRAYQPARARKRAEWLRRGVAFGETWPSSGVGTQGHHDNPLRAFSNARTEGRGIWKWDHYFDAYHRHLERFRGEEVHVLEIGIYSGGSLDMWHEYFGPRCHVYGVDRQKECLRYQDDSTSVFIGDQADRDFWRRFRGEVPKLDVVVDDGGHKPHQQAASLEELLPHLQPGGVYVVEDLHGPRNLFAAYVDGLIEALHAYRGIDDPANPERRMVSKAAGFQSLIESIHSYPYLTVIEKRQEPLGEFVAPMRGSEWEPFLD